MKIYSPAQMAGFVTKHPKPERWTAVIPAAGRGSRLNYSKPKILYPIAGRTILDRLIDLLAPLCGHFVFILSPLGAPHISPVLENRLSGRFEIAIQTEPKGMADAISHTLPLLLTPYTLILWGDQVALRPSTVRSSMSLHEASEGANLTLPLVRRADPYVHYETDDSRQFVRVLEKREGAAMPPEGMSDCGLFACTTARLKDIFQQTPEQQIVYGKNTGEWNFLPMLPLFEAGGNTVNVLQLESVEESVGVNDVTDAALIEKHFKQLPRL